MIPGYLDLAQRAIRSGRFLEALAHLQSVRLRAGEALYDTHQALLADTLQLTGDSRSAERLAKNLVQRTTVDPSTLARCRIVLGTIARDRRDIASCLEHFQRAGKYAAEAADSELGCWAKLRLM